MLSVLHLDPLHVGLPSVVNALDAYLHLLTLDPASHHNDVDLAGLSGHSVRELH
jgi:hypothetical protein